MAYSDSTNVGNLPGDGPLRPYGRSAGMMPETEDNLPSTPSACAKAQRPALALVRDLVAGPEAVREAAGAYLPKAPGEDPTNYKDRLLRSPYYNVIGHTIKGMVGQVFRRDPVFEDDVPPVIVEQLENVDLGGTHVDVFLRGVLQDAMTAGHAAILVDYPKTGGTQVAAAEQSEIRPYWVPIRKEDILSWRTDVVNGHLVLTQLVLRECTMVPRGQYGEAMQERYRVLYRDDAGTVGFRLEEVSKNKTVTVVDEGTYPTQIEIPVAEVLTSGSVGMFESAPPLLDLAYLNLAHYQQSSDYANSLHLTCVPLLVTIGLDANGSPLTIGPNTLISLPTGGDAKYVSHDGASLAACKASLDDLKADMGTLGLSMLSPSKRTAETAQAKAIDKSAEDSALSVTARGLEDATERALGFHARYLNLPEGGGVDINREYDEQQMAADMLNAWTGAVKDAGVPARFMVAAMQEGDLIEGDEDVELIASEMEASAQAAADQAALIAETNAKNKMPPAPNMSVGTPPVDGEMGG